MISRSNSNIYHTRLTSGLALAWVNSYSAVVIKTPHTTLLFDPVGMTVPEDTSVDLIGISHEHPDHWDPGLVANLQQRTGAVLATTPFLASQLASRISRDTAPTCRGALTRALQVGDVLLVGNVSLMALRCDHAARHSIAFLVQTSRQLENPPVSPLTKGGSRGVTIYLPGDSSPFPEMAQLAEMYHLDILLWMGTALEDGARIAQLVRPKALVTYAITPPAAGERARRILTSLTPQVPFYALERHQVLGYP